MRVNPRALSRPPAFTQTRTFTDPEQPGQELTLTLRPLNFAELCQTNETAAPLVEEWTGPKGQAVGGYPVQGGPPVPVTPALLSMLVMLEGMQVPQSGEEPYTWEDLLILSVTMPTAWTALTKWLNEVQERKATGLDPNCLRAGAAPSSLPRCETDESTPTSSSGETLSSAPSTNGSESKANSYGFSPVDGATAPLPEAATSSP